jgi:hypothetical protein
MKAAAVTKRIPRPFLLAFFMTVSLGVDVVRQEDAQSKGTKLP